MIILKNIESNLKNKFHILLSYMLNIEYGYKKYNTNLEINTEPYEPTLILELPDQNNIEPIQFKFNINQGYLYLLLNTETNGIELINEIKEELEKWKCESKNYIISNCTITTSNNDIKRKFNIESQYLEDNTNFIWNIEIVTSINMFNKRIFNTFDQLIPFVSGIFYDEIDLFEYDHEQVVWELSQNKIKYNLSEPLRLLSEALHNEQVGILVNHDTYEIEFISQYTAILCTTIKNNNLHCGKPMKLGNKIKNKMKNMNCYLCEYPLYNLGYLIYNFNILNINCNEILLKDLYSTFIDPLINHFTDNTNSILTCVHCMRIICNLIPQTTIEIDNNDYNTFNVPEFSIEYNLVKIPYQYTQLVKNNNITKKYSSLLESFEIGKQSRVIKIGRSQFYIIDTKDIKDILINNNNIRESNIPILPVVLFWYNSDTGYV